MKVVFLDFDGVLNSHDFCERVPGQCIIGIDPLAVAQVQRIVDATGAAIVISSTWRLLHKLIRLKDTLFDAGLRAKILGTTPNIGRERGHEIQAWIDATPRDVDAFVILDDDSDMVHLMPRLVQTTFHHGLTSVEADCAIAMLNEKEMAA